MKRLQCFGGFEQCTVLSAPAGATTRKDGGKTYYLYHTVTVKGSGITLTYDEDYYPITGYTQRDKNVPNFDNSNKAYLYYTRNAYDLRFVNYGAVVKTETKYYQADISGEGFTPDYPDTLEGNAYEFDGWYTDPFFSESGKFDFTGATMPAGSMVLHAHWTPKTHTVKAYQTKDAMENGADALHTWQNVPHGTAVTNPPADPLNGQYTFVGWFYISDTGEEKAFDFSMSVNRDLNLYAKWSSNTLMTYTVKYELADGTQIAPPTTGSALAGSTKTFNAKTGTELNEGYQSGYFPNTSSHSVTIDIANPTNNTYTFVYVPKAEVTYTVKYLEKGTNNQLAAPKTVTTHDAVVTETFKQITGYAPDAYQKQLVLAAEGNEIIFWYVKDEDHAPVHIIHWTQNIAGEGYTEYQSSTNLNGVIGTVYSETPLTIAGFTYNGTKSNASGELTAAGLVLNLYYDRIEYPYEFRFLEQGTERPLADAVTGNARYQAQVTQTAKTIPGYTLVSAENQAINIAIEDPANVADKNVKTFYYTEQTVDIKYVVVGPDGCGTLDNYQESQLKVMTGEVKGSMPAVAEGFKFVGWYKDQDCTQLVDAAWVADSKLTPDKTKNYGTAEKAVMGYEAATYYAKFEYDAADLTITKTGWEAIDENQSFIFKVVGDNFEKKVVIKGNGSVTIKGLKRGDVAVTASVGDFKKSVTIHVLDKNYEDLKGKFQDISGHWAEETILEAVYRGLFNGVSSDLFDPDSAITRAMFVTVLYRMDGQPAVDQKAGFTDVAEGSYYAAAVDWAAKNGIVNGVSETSFDPDAPITREQMAAILYRYAGKPRTTGTLSGYSDRSKVSSYAETAMAWAVKEGIITGKSATTLDPAGKGTRAEVAVMLYRYLTK
ncbi:MAG: hypothetical protein EGQ46_03545 [Clostridiales bacterium]|nr:hypothetical protein [Clostridiales bacterium]